MTTPAGRPRRDAERNRARIVEAARTALAESSDARIHDIAKRAGVGQGTLYRNFPTREALLAEVYQRDVEQLVRAATALLDQHDPAEALGQWLNQLIDSAEGKRGVLAALEPAAWQHLVERGENPVQCALGRLLQAGQSAGLLRADVDAHQVLLLTACLSRLDGDEWKTTARPLMAVIVDGLKTDGGNR